MKGGLPVYVPPTTFENAPASAFPAACCGVSERTTIKWDYFLTFRRFPAACCRELQSLGSGARKQDTVPESGQYQAYQFYQGKSSGEIQVLCLTRAANPFNIL
jgi:hypothetical protein